MKSPNARTPEDGLSVNVAYSSGKAQLNENETLIKKMVFATDKSTDSDVQPLPLKLLLRIMNQTIFHHPTADLRLLVDEPNKAPNSCDLPVANTDVFQYCDRVELPTSLTSAISWQICYECSTGGSNVDSTVKNILLLTKDYRWDAKAVLILASFASIFGKFWLDVHLFHTNSPLSKAAALLKQGAERSDNAGSNPKRKLELLSALIEEILDVTEKIVDFYESRQNEYLSTAAPGSLAEDIAVIVYWTSRSIVVGAMEILALGGKGRGMGINNAKDITSLTDNLYSKKIHLVDLIAVAIDIDIARTFGSSNVDNSKSLKVLFRMPGLYDCYRRKQISYEHLKSKVVILFLTDLDPDLTSGAEYAILQQMYIEKWHNQSRIESTYELVWVPLLKDSNWTEEKLMLFKSLRNKMEWHSVGDPSKVDSEFIKFAKEKWNLPQKHGLLVKVMDSQGKIVHENAIYMMCTWGSLSYPFTAARERRLWEETTWSISLLADDIEQNMHAWIKEGKHICLYGGENVAWIREFTDVVKKVASKNGISLELLYVGRSKVKEELSKVIDVIEKEGLSRTLDWNLIWYFWVRLENMCNSKQQTVESESIKNDPIIQGVCELLRYDLQHQNWAMIASGQGEEMVMADGIQMCKGLQKLLKKKLENTRSFVPDLDGYICKTLAVFSNLHPTTIDQSGKDTRSFVRDLDGKFRENVPVSSDLHPTTIDQPGKETKGFAPDLDGYIRENLPVFSNLRPTIIDQSGEDIESVLLKPAIDNLRSLKALFHEEFGEGALYDCFSKKTVSIENLRKKAVALFITEIDPELTRTAEYAILYQMYIEKRYSLTKVESQYEVIWVPVADDWTEEKYRWFLNLRNQMEWLSVQHPSVVSPVVIRFFREKWNFSKKPLLVVMDFQGTIVNNNAIHMMCVWGSVSYPFTANREKLLWEEMSWTIDLLADNLEPNIATWMNEGRHICLYGGDDMEWIRKFTRVAKDVARESWISLELLYVGKNKSKERITKSIIELIVRENLSRALDWNLIWYFWLRLESMWHSKGQFSNPENVKNDLIMQGIIAMLSYGSSDQGFAVISRGFGEMVKGNGEHMLKALIEHGRWRARENEIGFVLTLDEYLRKIHLDAPHHCTTLILPDTGAMLDSVACAECGRLMETFTMFRCCLD